MLLEIAMAEGIDPTANGLPVAGDKLPSAGLIANTDTSFDFEFTTYSQPPERSTRSESGA